MTGSDQFINMSMAQVLQIPLTRPIFNREIASGTYTTTAYYLAFATVSVITFFLYPIVTSLVSFYFYGFDEHSFADLMIWMSIMSLVAFAGSFWGFMIGALSKNEVIAV